MTMLARQEEYYEEEQRVLTPEEEEKELRKAPKEPLFKTVLDTRLRSHGQLLFRSGQSHRGCGEDHDRYQDNRQKLFHDRSPFPVSFFCRR